MKKTIAIVILAALLLTFFISGCSSRSHYKYADNNRFELYTSLVDDEFWAYVYEHSEEADVGDLVGLIGRISERDFSNLNMDWEKMQGATVKKLIPSVEELEVAPRSILFGMQYYSALYNKDTGEVYLFPEYFIASEKKRLQFLTHELMHAGLSSQEGSQIEEGLADYFTSLFMKNVGYPMEETSYPNEMTVATWLVTLFGEEKVVTAVHEGNIGELIDSATKHGMGDKLERALVTMYQERQNICMNVVYDILCHATVNTGKSYADVGGLLNYARDICKLNSVDFDYYYFKKVLHG